MIFQFFFHIVSSFISLFVSHFMWKRTKAVRVDPDLSGMTTIWREYKKYSSRDFSIGSQVPSKRGPRVNWKITGRIFVVVPKDSCHSKKIRVPRGLLLHVFIWSGSCVIFFCHYFSLDFILINLIVTFLLPSRSSSLSS